MSRVRDADVRHDAVREALRCRRREKVRDRRVLGVGRRDEAGLERIFVEGRDPHPRLRVEEAREVGNPVRAAGRRPDQRELGERAADPREVLQVVREVVARRTAGDVRAVRQAVVREASVQLGLVAGLEPIDRAPADPVHERPRLGGGVGRAVELEVDSEDHAGPERLRQRRHDPHPVPRQRVAGARRLAHARDRPPCPVARVAADPEVRRLAGREVAHELDEHRIDRVRVIARVLGDCRVLDRQPEEPGRDRAARRAADGQRQRPGGVRGAAGGRRGDRGDPLLSRARSPRRAQGDGDRDGAREHRYERNGGQTSP